MIPEDAAPPPPPPEPTPAPPGTKDDPVIKRATQVLAVLVVACLGALLVAGTVMLIRWML